MTDKRLEVIDGGRDVADVAGDEQGEVAIYDPDKGLKTVATSEAAEKYWRRAKDATKLYAAIEAKLKAQAEYVVWRDRAVMPSREKGGSGSNQYKKIGRVAVRGPDLPESDPGKRVVYRWRKRLCANSKGMTIADDEKIKRATIVDADKVARVLEDAGQQCQRIVEQQNANTVRGTEGTGEFERYTPAEYIEAARKVLGEIDLDPATSAQAQETVKALDFFTEIDNGLDRDWIGRVWLNPPYHRELAPQFIDKLVNEIAVGRVTAAIMLTNNCTDTEWFLTAAHVSQSICFTNGRIKFTTPKSGEVLPTQGQAFFYFGPDAQRFEDVFCVIGFCVRLSREYEITPDADQ
jgi:phage N-6-adenine-methyltransferase